MDFKLVSNFEMSDAQSKAVESIVNGLNKDYDKQTLLGITGSGKTFCMANIIKKYNKPTLVLAHNKILAAQLYQEFKQLFPENRVEYFISYYDYYQPESYIPTSDTYIEKEATVNSEIEKMRIKAIASLMSRKDTIVIASISCIYGSGNPKDFKDLSVAVKIGEKLEIKKFLKSLVDIQYTRDRGLSNNSTFRMIGDVIDIMPAYEDIIIRIELFGDVVESVKELDRITFKKINDLDEIRIYPAKQFVVPEEKLNNAILQIENDLNERVKDLGILESERLKQKVRYDIEMMKEVGYCNGIENYSRYFDGRKKGEPSFVLLDYFPSDFLMLIDESHQTIPQSRAMYKGDYSRKKNLVDFGFRLPSAFDNRPLKFEEFEKYFNHLVFVSATPADYEITNSKNVSELIIRPTGLLDPEIEIKPIDNQVEDLLLQIKEVVNSGFRVLVTTLTKKMSQDLTEYLSLRNIKVRYMHSDIDALDRIEIIRELRLGKFDVLVGINLLREGLDIPEVSLVCILDADKEGFLRDQRSLIQTIGRASRNSFGKVIMYADRITESIKSAMDITNKRRYVQIEYNKIHNITPKTVVKNVDNKAREIKTTKHLTKNQIEKEMIELESKMKKYAASLDFENAIKCRDRLDEIKKSIEK